MAWGCCLSSTMSTSSCKCVSESSCSTSAGCWQSVVHGRSRRTPRYRPRTSVWRVGRRKPLPSCLPALLEPDLLVAAALRVHEEGEIGHGEKQAVEVAADGDI